MSSSMVNLVYLIAGVLFILGIKGLTKPFNGSQRQYAVSYRYAYCRGDYIA